MPQTTRRPQSPGYRPMTDHIPDPTVPAPKKRPGSSIDRLVRVLLEITEDPQQGTEQRLQAARISLDAIGRKKPIKRKTDKDKAIERALGGNKKAPKTSGG